eukprot:1176950-Prorocentrum_minimum.AAC.2
MITSAYIDYMYICICLSLLLSLPTPVLLAQRTFELERKRHVHPVLSYLRAHTGTHAGKRATRDSPALQTVSTRSAHERDSQGGHAFAHTTGEEK